MSTIKAANSIECLSASEWTLHNGMLDAKAQVEAQYGKDSNECQSLGLKKKSEYKKPGRPSTASKA